MYKESSEFEDTFQKFIFYRTYARWLEKEGRREHWPEPVNRYENYMMSRVPQHKQNEFKEACEAIKRLEVMGSMRCLWTAGKALEREGLCAYNCAYLPIDSIKAFGETLYLLMNGVGVGYSVERQYINMLPSIPELNTSNETIVITDSKLGWADAYYKIIKSLYNGYVPHYDTSKIRAKGSPLKTFGGRASGPEVLENLIRYTINTFKNAQGRKLNSLECNDILCYIASIVLVGGVRRSSCISLTNPSDERMQHAKDGQFWNTHPFRALANISSAYTEKPSTDAFMSEFLSLIRSGSGERGIFNREACEQSIQASGLRKTGYEWGVNPCGERVLRPRGLCNLSEVIINSNDTKDQVCYKVRLATILGCVQSTITHFNFISREWKKNAEDERLIGVSLTGLRDHNVLGHATKEAKLWLTEMYQTCYETAKEWSQALEINMPACLTCTKPSGTVSSLCNTASGLHTRYAQHYLRRVRVADTDPIAHFLMNYGVPYYPDVGQSKNSADTWVFEFPIKAPENSVLQNDVTAIEQLDYWLMIKKYWCTGNPSCTIHVDEDEWIDVASWVYNHWNTINGLTFLPKTNAVYELMPYEEISEQEYNQRKQNFPKVDFTQLANYENGDFTEGAKEFACAGGQCEV